MKKRTRLIISIATGVAAAAIALLYTASVRAEVAEAQEEALAKYGGDLVQVCVATRDIDPGETIDEQNTHVEEWLASMLPEDAIDSLEDALGQTATSHIPENSVLSQAYFERDDGSLEVPDGMVAVAIACDAEHAVGGVLEEGDRVDVYVSSSGIADPLTEAQVLDTNTLADGGGDLEWVMLAVDASAVQELLAAVSNGTITLVVPGEGAEIVAADAASAEVDEADGDEADEAADEDADTAASDAADDADDAEDAAEEGAASDAAGNEDEGGE